MGVQAFVNPCDLQTPSALLSLSELRNPAPPPSPESTSAGGGSGRGGAHFSAFLERLAEASRVLAERVLFWEAAEGGGRLGRYGANAANTNPAINHV